MVSRDSFPRILAAVRIVVSRVILVFPGLVRKYESASSFLVFARECAFALWTICVNQCTSAYTLVRVSGKYQLLCSPLRWQNDWFSFRLMFNGTGVACACPNERITVVWWAHAAYVAMNLIRPHTFCRGRKCIFRSVRYVSCTRLGQQFLVAHKLETYADAALCCVEEVCSDWSSGITYSRVPHTTKLTSRGDSLQFRPERREENASIPPRSL